MGYRDRAAAVWARVAGWPRVLWEDLSPFGGQPLPTLRLARFPWLGRLPHAAAVAYAALVAVVSISQFDDLEGLGAELGVDAWYEGYYLGIALGLPGLLCLYRPMAGWWASVGLGMLLSEAARPEVGGPVWASPVQLAHLGVLFLVALRSRPRVLVELWLLTLAAGGILVQRMPGQDAASQLGEMSILSAAVLIAGGALHARGRARQVSAAERARRALLEERTRIARELHDVVAHHMSVIAVQAEAAPYRVTDAPEELTKSFATIRANALSALTELRLVLGVLREETPAAEADPQPTLERLHELVANVRGAGLSVTAEVHGTQRPLPPGVELSAYRILQEALSNVVRHAPGADVQLDVRYGPDALELRVVNGPPHGKPAGPPGPGHGLMGMRERVAMLEGKLTAEARPDGGWEVAAVLPVAAGAGEGGG
jgi:signal transduction histidine kinase